MRIRFDLLRNGPNPFFRPQTLESVFGKVGWHFFEGDGMLHAIRLGGGKAFYRNKFVETPALKMEKESGKPLYWSNLEADPAACLAGGDTTVLFLSTATHDNPMVILRSIPLKLQVWGDRSYSHSIQSLCSQSGFSRMGEHGRVVADTAQAVRMASRVK